jgi:hypothetical protein
VGSAAACAFRFRPSRDGQQEGPAGDRVPSCWPSSGRRYALRTGYFPRQAAFLGDHEIDHRWPGRNPSGFNGEPLHLGFDQFSQGLLVTISRPRRIETSGSLRDDRLGDRDPASEDEPSLTRAPSGACGNPEAAPDLRPADQLPDRAARHRALAPNAVALAPRCRHRCAGRGLRRGMGPADLASRRLARSAGIRQHSIAGSEINEDIGGLPPPAARRRCVGVAGAMFNSCGPAGGSRQRAHERLKSARPDMTTEGEARCADAHQHS